MMISYGIEGIAEFDFARRQGFVVEDPFFTSVPEDFDKGLKKYKHIGWFLPNDYCKEKHLRDRTKNGQDMADSVNLFFIETHGSNDKGIISLMFNNKQDNLFAHSSDWRLGQECNWLMLHSCSTLDLNYISELLPIFQNLHEICGAYGSVNNFFTTDEMGEKLADNLTEKGKPVADAWIDSLEDWLTNNSPMVVAAENRDSIDPITGMADWSSTTMSRDHLSGHGTTVADIPNSDIYWLSVKWKEGYLLKQRRVQIK